MKLSKLIHLISIIVGLAGVLTFGGAILGGADNLVFGITKIDALFCSAILILIAIWTQIGANYYLQLEKNRKII
ncbi:MAG: hypothetical protein COX02_01415 [Candidatus Vogelbacteria bacterium CG22_combo_CG10-13_8_21_14_all_37_9]|uniref:Uncharacterized protein n=1 Tax=Candidatus Vogelbacteria bacterium CG22_combo_CG10-13_8_21_14_all_37_9 TaxID=1975046 RepID=A0A2H0BKY5_9BACT|nr:MAG: hypothetical protein COX02_01415 [Candidatus Vogelbacteria bacterium CG22_combo_CG10-13_8_21_14_all_37_9]